MATLKDVAEKAKVSVATVSYVLNGNHHQVGEKTIKKVEAVAKELNYKPNTIAKSLRTNKTKTIGIIAEDLTVFNTPTIIDGIGEFFESNGYNIILNNLRLFSRIGNHYEDAVKYKALITDLIDSLVNAETDGIIYLGAHFRDIEGILKEIDKPMVFTYCFNNDGVSGVVNYKEKEASYAVLEYLIRLGHKNLGIITGIPDSISTVKRLEGCVSCLEDHKNIVDSKNVQVLDGDWTYETGYKGAVTILNRQKNTTAIFAMNDLMAIGVMDAVKNMGLNVPKDISVIGFDNRECSMYSNPSLTTVQIPLKEMGCKSAQLLLDIINNRESERELKIELDCELIKRESAKHI